MKHLKRREPLILLIGDVFFFMVALWLSLLFRSLTLPTKASFLLHLSPFGFLFVVWILVFFIAGLYEKRTMILRSKLPGVIFNTQVVNSLIAVLFFYLIPYFGIAPKTILFIYLLVSFIVMLIWRAYIYFLIVGNRANKAILIGSGKEMKELFEEVNRHPLYNLQFITSIDLDENSNIENQLKDIVSNINNHDATIIATDLTNPKASAILPELYKLIFSNVVFVDMHKIYEDVFNRVPLSLLRYDWFLENVSASPRATYDAMKRLMDLVLALILGTVTLLLYPLVMLFIKYEDGGKIFISQDRVGKENKLFRIHKFRTMTSNDHGAYNAEGKSELKVTRIGKFLRDTRIDELPQLWSVVRGDQSLVGPRPELPPLTKLYEKAIPYYNVRHLIKPGLSGWAQIYQENHPHHGEAVEQTTEKLSYDFYYIKNRSLLLDLKIALWTIKTLLSRVGK